MTASIKGVRVLYVVNDPEFLFSHRGALVEAVRGEGAHVMVAGPKGEPAGPVEKRGLSYYPLSFSRWGMNPLRELTALQSFASLYRQVRPDIVHHVTMKPVVYGTLAASIVRNISVVNAISGLGFSFISSGFGARIRRMLIRASLGVGARCTESHFIFQNEDDRRVLGDASGISRQCTTIIRGSGVDLHQFCQSREPEGSEPLVVMPARILRDKGVQEFVGAVRLLTQWGVRARFIIAGAQVPRNPAGISVEKCNEWIKEGLVEMPGHVMDIKSLFDSSAIVVLPSYREGLPKALIEAAAVGRPIVTTDVPGCREVVRDGENGFLVPARNAAGLAHAVRTLIDDRALRERFGRASRRLVEAGGFSLEEVIVQTLKLYGHLGASQGLERTQPPPEAIGQ